MSERTVEELLREYAQGILDIADDESLTEAEKASLWFQIKGKEYIRGVMADQRARAAAGPDPEVRSDPGHVGHVVYLDVDEHDVLYTSCHYPGGALCGDATVLGETTPERAAAVRRAARAFRGEPGE